MKKLLTITLICLLLTGCTTSKTAQAQTPSTTPPKATLPSTAAPPETTLPNATAPLETTPPSTVAPSETTPPSTTAPSETTPPSTAAPPETTPPSTAAPSETVHPTVTEPLAESIPEIPVNIYVPDENAVSFDIVRANVYELDPFLITALLIEHSMLNEDICLNRAEIVDNQLNLDFNQAFSDQLNTYGTSGERMMMGCVVNTFLSVFDVEFVYITVDDEILESGHAIYDFSMGFFE